MTTDSSQCMTPGGRSGKGSAEQHHTRLCKHCTEGGRVGLGGGEVSNSQGSPLKGLFQGSG